MYSKILILWCQLAVLVSSTEVQVGYASKDTAAPRLDSSPGDNGEPLILTPLLENNETEKARRLASVQPFLGDFKSYAGFFTVNKTYDSNNFFWFFPATKSPETAPVMVILQGGPGTSSLISIFAENGPYVLDKNNLSTVQLREYTWTNAFSLLYIDNPVGVGYSFTKHDEGYCTDADCYSENLYRTVKQFYQMFPEFAKNDLFIHGISYGGKFAPALAYAIYNHNKVDEPKINLKGVAASNGFSDPIKMLDFATYFYQLGLIDVGLKGVFQRKENEIAQLIRAGETRKACDKYFELLVLPDSLFQNVTGYKNYYNYLTSAGVYVDHPIGTAKSFLQQDFVRRAIHVGNATFSNGQFAQDKLRVDFLRSVASWIKVLLDNDVEFLFYNGATDIIVPYPFTVNFLQKLDWKGAAEYKTTLRYIWRVDANDTEVAGYIRNVRNLHEGMIRNSGHDVFIDQPRAAYDIIKKFVFNKL